jgi:XisI protein
MAIEHYRQLIQDLLTERAQRSRQSSALVELEKQTIFDTERDHYQLVNVGWKQNGHRNYGCVLHLDIKNGKIWIQQDGTEEGIANALVEQGVPKHDIVLAFHDPAMRKHTEFGMG